MNTNKQSSSRSSILTILCCVAIIAIFPQLSEAQSKSKGGTGRDIYTGTIFFLPGPTVGGPGRTRMTSRTFTLRLDCTTPREDLSRLAGILKSEGQNGLLRAITREKCGVIQIGANVGRDINTVSMTNTEEGEQKITMLFERWMEFFEVRYGTRSRDYPFTYIELFVDEKGKLEGTMIPAAKVQFKDDNTVEIENFAAFPARMTGVRRNR